MFERGSHIRFLEETMEALNDLVRSGKVEILPPRFFSFNLH